MEGIIAEINNKHTFMINKDFYYYAKSVFETIPEVSKAWLTQLNNSKAISRYSTMKDRESTLKLLPKGISPDNVKTIILKEDKAAYLSINIFNTFNINGDMEIIKPFLTTIKDYQSLIIDIRGNSGGDSRYWCQHLVPMLINKPLVDTQYTTYRGGSFTETFLKSRYGAGYEKLEPILKINELKLKNAPPELKDSFKYFSKNIIDLYPENSIGFKGKIYLIVDGGVFSSSEAFATFSKSTGFATIVGERTGGDGIGDDPAMCVLPNSGYIFRFPMVMGLTSDGTCNFEYKTEADIKVSAETSSDLANDKAVQTVLNIVTNNDHSLD